MGIYTKQRQKRKRLVEVANDGIRQVNTNTKGFYQLSHKRNVTYETRIRESKKGSA